MCDVGSSSFEMPVNMLFRWEVQTETVCKMLILHMYKKRWRSPRCCCCCSNKSSASLPRASSKSGESARGKRSGCSSDIQLGINDDDGDDDDETMMAALDDGNQEKGGERANSLYESSRTHTITQLSAGSSENLRKQRGYLSMCWWLHW